MGSHAAMYLTFVVIVAFLGVAVAVDRKECHMKLGHPGNFHCCKDVQRRHENKDESTNPEKFKECFQPPNKPPPSCDTDICMAKKHGFVADDGSLDRTAFESGIVKQFSDDPQMSEAIKTKCINTDLEDYGPPGMCELTKLRHCVGLQAVMHCKEWDTTGPCSGIKNQVEECKSVV